MKLKMSDPNGIITISSDPDRALKVERKMAPLTLESLSEALAVEELTSLRAEVDRDDVILDKQPKSTSFKLADDIVKFQVHPTDPNKMVSIGANLVQRLMKPCVISFRKIGTYSPGILSICLE